MGKGEIARYEQFLLFPNVLKSCLLLMRQNEYLWSKGLTKRQNFTPVQIESICSQQMKGDQNGKIFSW